MIDRIAQIVARLSHHRPTQRRVQEIIADERCRMRRYQWKRRQRDPIFAVVAAMRGRIRAAIKGTAKYDACWGLIGCTRAELQAHLESRFELGMNWENYGEWEVDHKRPCASYDLSVPDQQYACFHFTNLQPLWKAENRRKAAKILTDG